MAPEALDSLTPEERHELYKMLRLKARALVDGTVEIGGALGGEQDFVKDEPTSPCWLQTTKRRPEFRFRALLNDGTREVRFERAVVGGSPCRRTRGL